MSAPPDPAKVIEEARKRSARLREIADLLKLGIDEAKVTHQLAVALQAVKNAAGLPGVLPQDKTLQSYLDTFKRLQQTGDEGVYYCVYDVNGKLVASVRNSQDAAEIKRAYPGGGIVTSKDPCPPTRKVEGGPPPSPPPPPPGGGGGGKFFGPGAAGPSFVETSTPSTSTTTTSSGNCFPAPDPVTGIIDMKGAWPTDLEGFTQGKFEKVLEGIPAGGNVNNTADFSDPATGQVGVAFADNQLAGLQAAGFVMTKLGTDSLRITHYSAKLASPPPTCQFYQDPIMGLVWVSK